MPPGGGMPAGIGNGLGGASMKDMMKGIMGR